MDVVLLRRNPVLPRVVPFGLFMLFVGAEEGSRLLLARGWIDIGEPALVLLYPVRIAVVFAALWYFRRLYTEIRLNDLRRLLPTVAACLCGLAVFSLWVRLEGIFILPPPGYDPGVLGDPAARMALIATRLCGAVLVVPVMEELFWRSFLVRYLIDRDFLQVAIGRFTVSAFVISTVLFALEHHLLVAGLMAGAAYNLLLLYTRSLAQCILAHAVTNLALGLYVLASGNWHFW